MFCILFENGLNGLQKALFLQYIYTSDGMNL